MRRHRLLNSIFGDPAHDPAAVGAHEDDPAHDGAGIPDGAPPGVTKGVDVLSMSVSGGSAG